MTIFVDCCKEPLEALMVVENVPTCVPMLVFTVSVAVVEPLDESQTDDGDIVVPAAYPGGKFNAARATLPLKLLTQVAS